MKEIPWKEQKHPEKELTLSLFAWPCLRICCRLLWSGAGLESWRGARGQGCAGWGNVGHSTAPRASSKAGGAQHCSSAATPCAPALGQAPAALPKQTNQAAGEWFHTVSKSIRIEYPQILLKKWSITPIWQLDSNQPISECGKRVAQNLGMNPKPPFCSTLEDSWLFHGMHKYFNYKIISTSFWFQSRSLSIIKNVSNGSINELALKQKLYKWLES